jgi:hypothetical protein
MFFSDRVVLHRKIHRIRNEAKFVGSLVQRLGLLDGSRNPDMGMERHKDEAARPSTRLFHCAFSPIFIRHDNDSGVGAKMKVPEHMTGREGGNHELFRIVSNGISPELWIGRTVYRGFSRYLDLVISRVGSVV